jgi:hypothetical protein
MYRSQSDADTMENRLMESKYLQINKGSVAFVVFGWIFFTISLLFIPILFGAAAFFMGLLTFWERSQVHGAILMAFAALGTILGTLFSFIVAGSFFI